jgi:ketosteroid isomerase-like protein
MTGTKPGSGQRTEQHTPPSTSTRNVVILALTLGTAVVVGYAILNIPGLSIGRLTSHVPIAQSSVALTDPESKPFMPDVRLTREKIESLLDMLDGAIRRKDVDGIVRHMTSDATITIHMKQGPQQQQALLTRDDYRKTLAMAFAFPSANDFTRTNTSVSLASDERSAKVSYKTTETLRQANREFKTEGEETLVFNIRDGKPMITSLEQTFPGDST